MPSGMARMRCRRATDLAVLPGGFSYGDYLRLWRHCGALAGHGMQCAPMLHAAGWCSASATASRCCANRGLLPGVLMRNAQLRFVCRRQHLRVERNDTAFTSAYDPGQVIDVCVAHGEGNYVADPETLARLEGEGRVAFRYLRRAWRDHRRGQLQRLG